MLGLRIERLGVFLDEFGPGRDYKTAGTDSHLALVKSQRKKQIKRAESRNSESPVPGEIVFMPPD